MSKYIPASRQNLPTLLLMAVLIALLGYQSVANRLEADPAPQANPTGTGKLATFDLEKTFNSLDQKKAADADLLKVAEAMNLHGEAEHKKIKQMETELEDHLPGTPKYKELSEKYSMAAYDYRALLEFDKAKIDKERAKTLKRIYLDIRTAVAQLAKERGYDIVFVDDSINEIPTAGEEETNRQISARRMVYTSPSVDITQELIAHMNKAFAAPAPATKTP
jgi:Skp family chaperone for outer membrane proteins